jgi:hypothetical protein
VRPGLRVEAVWRPRSEWGPTLENIEHFRPSGEPDVAIPDTRDGANLSPVPGES